MSFFDLTNILQWWATFFFIGIIFIPITSLIFPTFFDKGYIFAKIIGIALISYSVFLFGFLKILSFNAQNIFIIAAIFLLINFFVKRKIPLSDIRIRSYLAIFILEECLFLGILILWSFIHAHQPEIHGLEKYMDYGFINSILRAKYFPPLDMWLTPYPVNYYYFGHLVTAVLTKLSFLSSDITFNLMLSTIAAIGFTAVFSIAANLLHSLKKEGSLKISIIGGLLSAFILNFAGNLHTIYLFFKPYENENPVPFWQLVFSPSTFPNSYWYPNATRFIHNTIHEFPIYSNVVSDLHGHFLDVPFVLLTIAVLLSLFLKSKLEIGNYPSATLYVAMRAGKLEIPLISFLLAVMYMTNAWDGIIYFLLAVIVIFVIQLKSIVNFPKNISIKHCASNIVKDRTYVPRAMYYALLILVGFFLFSLPFSLNFKPFASGIGILCAPKFLTDIGRLGPFLFETNHCQHSPLWQILILYGFFYFWVISFGVFIFSKIKSKYSGITSGDIFIAILAILSTLLIIIPEFIYVKDIYPAHYRANTMFKLVYQSFMMLSLCSGYIIVRLFLNYKFLILDRWYFKFIYWLIGLSTLALVSLYPYLAINSYFGDLKIYSGINGTNYLKPLYPTDYEAIRWINKNIQGQPVILEAQGDSYTDYSRVSSNTGLPTVLGWTVHEWLWRGTYDIPAPRIPEIEKMYESENLEETKTLLKKYGVTLVFMGDLERQKYPNLNENKFKSLGKIIFEKGTTRIYKIN
jgi:YYY domain-containing protein